MTFRTVVLRRYSLRNSPKRQFFLYSFSIHYGVKFKSLTFLVKLFLQIHRRSTAFILVDEIQCFYWLKHFKYSQNVVLKALLDNVDNDDFSKWFLLLLFRKVISWWKRRQNKDQPDTSNYAQWELDYILTAYPPHGLFYEYLEMGKVFSLTTLQCNNIICFNFEVWLSDS